MTGGKEALILSAGDKTVECQWISDSDGEERLFSFDFSKNDAKKCVARVRNAAGDWGQRMLSRTGSNVDGSLVAFLQSGADLFDAVFRDEDIKNHIETLSHGITINVYNSITSIAIPWGLLCASGVNETDTGRLFGVRFNIIAVETAFKRTVHNEFEWVFRSWINGNHYSSCASELEECEQEFSAAIKDSSFFWVPPDASPPWPPPDEICDIESNRFIYAYAHRDGQLLEFSNKGVKHTPHKLIEKSPGKGGTDVVFINACGTVHSAADIAERLFTKSGDSFREIAIIATEFEVPSKFAMRFGLEFVDRLTQKSESIKQIMNTMRKKHAPLSVVYALHHLNDWRIIPPMALIDPTKAKRYRDHIENINYSEDILNGGQK